MAFIGLGGEPDRHLLKGADIVYESPGAGKLLKRFNAQGIEPIIVLDEIDKLGHGRDGKATGRN